MWRNANLVGQRNARDRLETPALLLELPHLRGNVAAMATFSATRGVALRPHVKAHKSVMIARLQVAAGAVGLSCATIGELEAMIEGNFTDLLLTSPLATPSSIDRLAALVARSAARLSVVVDCFDVLAPLSRAASAAAQGLGIFVDYTAGYGRTGLTDAPAVRAMAERVAQTRNLHLAGLQAYAGHLQHVRCEAERAAKAADIRRLVEDVLAFCRKGGIYFPVVSGVGTGTHRLDGPPFTEFQVGSYLFGDVEYDAVLGRDAGRGFHNALFLQASVVSRDNGDRVTLDAGTKSMASDGLPPRVYRGADLEDNFVFAGDEHGRLLCRGRKPAWGSKVEFLTPHCDPTVNLHDAYHVVDGDDLVAVWRIDRRR